MVTSHDDRAHCVSSMRASCRPISSYPNVAMPTVSGDRPAQGLLRRYPALPVLLVTGYSRNAGLDGPRAANVVDVIRKSTSFSTIVGIIGRSLAQ